MKYIKSIPLRVKRWEGYDAGELELLASQLYQEPPEIRHITDKKYKVTWGGRSYEIPVTTVG